MRAPRPAGRARRPMVVLALLACAVVASACDGLGGAAPAPSTTTTAPSSAHRLPLATLRNKYLAVVDPANAAFARFAGQLQAISPATTGTEVAAIVGPAAAAVATSARRLYALRSSSSPTVANDLYEVAARDNTVWQALRDLELGWGSRAFAFSSWQGAFVQAVTAANGAATTLRRALGVKVNA